MGKLKYKFWIKRIVVLALCFCFINNSVLAYADSNSNAKSKDKTENLIKPGNIGGYSFGIKKSVNDIVEEYKFNIPKTGHGFAAERGNSLISNLEGKKSKVIGDNNAKNGADRVIFQRGTGKELLIQDKYYANAAAGIDACFDSETGVFRYVDGSGNPMKIEVPKDQYDDAVKEMAMRIKDGKVEGVTNPDDAKNIILKGKLTYKQAQNLAKAGTVESLAYDAVNGVISSTCAFGISAAINYAIERLNGNDRKTALKESAIEGVKTGAVVFGTQVLVGQLSKAGALKVFTPSERALGRHFGKKFTDSIVQAFARDPIETPSNTAAKILGTQALTATVTIVLLSTDDVINIVRNRISPQQLIKNLAVTTAGVVGGYVGWYVGAIIGAKFTAGIGTYIGGTIGSTIIGGLSGFVSEKALSLVIKDDAEKMTEIIENEFKKLSDDYMLNQNEANDISQQLSEKLSGKTLKYMFASKDRTKFAKNLLTPMFKKEIAKRDQIKLPTENEMRASLLKEMEGIVFIH